VDLAWAQWNPRPRLGMGRLPVADECCLSGRASAKGERVRRFPMLCQF
jgi:hypothetical protein